MYKVSLKEVGARCQGFRKSGGWLQMEVALDTGYSLENVSGFENGRNDNLRLLMWYFAHGMTLDHIMPAMEGGKTDERI